ncbi:MAG: type II toxin-antitoxin system HicB family antitoxin [Anaerolineales bacterium]|nr:type II toxin-antitoxin system HicB family antitoxin [Anaerolineales bacterium]
MDLNLRNKAQKLAERSYVVEVLLDESTDGEPVFVALNPELEGCMGQGKTIEEAVNDLHEARIDYVYSLLEDDLFVPDPIHLATTTSSSFSQTLSVSYHQVNRNLDIKEIHEKPERLYEAAFLRT